MGSVRKPADFLPPLSALPGFIDPVCLYRIDELKARMGWRDASFRAACRVGLKTHRCGKRGFVMGHEVIAFITGGGKP